VSAPRLLITAGDPCGIGPEIVVKALADAAIRSACRAAIVGDPDLLGSAAEAWAPGLRLVPADPEDPFAPADGVGVVGVERPEGPMSTGVAGPAGGEAAWRAIRAAVDLCQDGRADALVTAPINKVALEMAGRGSAGHTELLQEMTGSPWSLTLFTLGDLRVVYYSRHLSLRAAIDAITADGVHAMLTRIAEIAPALGLAEPRIAVAALNPHAGEGGLFGDEEIRHIGPGIDRARAAGIDVAGPVPADTVFHLARQGRFDLVLGLYHDQVAAVMKSIDFHGTVSVTLGLPFPRLSVDHGTAFDIAGRGIADAENMRRTLLAAADHVRRATLERAR
jgi:4-phospho-D-threonate 3-dehydrogenase / 4-phospho-D-erythronate 3-dehydrogenase